jgi:hypothetical protein
VRYRLRHLRVRRASNDIIMRSHAGSLLASSTGNLAACLGLKASENCMQSPVTKWIAQFVADIHHRLSVSQLVWCACACMDDVTAGEGLYCVSILTSNSKATTNNDMMRTKIGTNASRFPLGIYSETQGLVYLPVAYTIQFLFIYS